MKSSRKIKINEEEIVDFEGLRSFEITVCHNFNYSSAKLSASIELRCYYKKENGYRSYRIKSFKSEGQDLDSFKASVFNFKKDLEDHLIQVLKIDTSFLERVNRGLDRD